MTPLPLFFLAVFLAKGCRFNKIDKDYVIKNKAELTKKSDEEIKETIMTLHNTGCKYNVLRNNCEHVATYIVYGVKACSQVKPKIHNIFGC